MARESKKRKCEIVRISYYVPVLKQACQTNGRRNENRTSYNKTDKILCKNRYI